ncbi:Hsp20/alpha crystallin family protein [Arthrobacter sp. 92]|jgi:HSP20 family protein|uniref:Hsp20/alpha crystallin family protein n=1 Tax=Arthrobacter sp. 92 TaxID=3418175 RepID=UPI0006A861F9|nr:alpha-crystallin [Arthrobacter sp. Hiyo6]
MSDLLRWSPFQTSRWLDTFRTSPFDLLRRTPSELMDAMDRVFQHENQPLPIRVEEYVDGNTLVVRAEAPGLDPDKDIDVSVVDGALQIRAERKEEKEEKGKDSYRSEFRYGSFFRSVPLPQEVKEEDIKATYKDGVLEVRTPIPERAMTESKGTKLPITRE